MDDDTIELGTAVPRTTISTEPELLARDDIDQQYLTQPWVVAELERQLGIPIVKPSREVRRATIRVLRQLFGKHAFYCGATGSGKSRAITLTFRQYLTAGGSVVVIEPKFEALLSYVEEARAAGLDPSQVIILSPRLAYVPGLNPWLVPDMPLVQTATDLADLILATAGSFGPRMHTILTNLFILVGIHRDLSLIEAIYCLQQQAVLMQLLARPAPKSASAADQLAHRQAVAYFTDFVSWTKGEKAAAIAPLMTRLSEVARSMFWQGLFGAKTNTIDLARLWQQQTVVLVHIDQAYLGSAGITLLAGYITAMLLKTAFRVSPKRHVYAIIDEAATAQQYLGDTLVQIIAIGRGLHLSLLIACQYFDQLAANLKHACLSQPAVTLLFRLGHSDSMVAAQALATGSEPILKRLIATKSERGPQTSRRFEVRDPHNRQVALSDADWQTFAEEDLFCLDTGSHLYEAAAAGGIARLYVTNPVTHEPVELRRYLSTCPEGDYRIVGPQPVAVEVFFAAPQIVKVEMYSESDQIKAWAKELSHLPVRHALLKAEGMEPQVIRLVEVPDLPEGARDSQFFQAALRANGASPEVIAATIADREKGAGTAVLAPAADDAEDTDGSLF